MVLVDFKGGATFLGLDGLPHVSALITNLADELPWSTACRTRCRANWFAARSFFAATAHSVLEYERARAAGAALEPLPTLVVIVDEFGELLSARPNSRPVHDDRPARPVARRAPAASLAAVRGGPHPHAGDAPVLPDGAADVLRDGVAQRHRRHRRLRQAAVAGLRLPAYRHDDAGEVPWPPTCPVPARSGRAGAPGRSRRPHRRRSKPATSSRAPAEPPPAEQAARRDRATETTSLRSSSTGYATPDRRRTRYGCRRSANRRHWTRCCRRWALTRVAGSAPRYGGLRVPVALVDRPFEQRRDTLIADLEGAKGTCRHRCAAERESTLLRTLIAALALTHTPRRCSSTSSTSVAARWPRWRGCRTSAVLPRRERERVTRTVAEVTDLVNRARSSSPARHRVHGGLPPGASGRRTVARGPVRRRFPGHRRLVHHAAGVRGAGGGHPGDRHSRPELRRPPHGGFRSVVRNSALAARRAADPVRVAARRPDGV